MKTEYTSCQTSKLSVIVPLLFLLLVACGSKKKSIDSDISVAPPAEVMKQFDQASEYLDKEQYHQASPIMESLLQENHGSSLETILLYNSGVAFEGMGECEKAANRYRQVVRLTNKKQPSIQAQALFRLSYAYECLNQDEKVVASLLDTRIRANHLPVEIAQAEVPARLAAAYARLGNRQVADRYFKEAERGLIVVQRKTKNSAEKKQVLARTLFLMGKLSPAASERQHPQNLLRSIRYMQPYLLKATELEASPWSEKAAKALVKAYDQAWDSILNYTYAADGVKDPEIEERTKTRQQIEAAGFALVILKELKDQKIVHQTILPVQNLFKRLESNERQLRKFMASASLRTGLTPEAKEREGLKRGGRVKSSPTSLEKNFKMPLELPEKKKDPNL